MTPNPVLRSLDDAVRGAALRRDQPEHFGPAFERGMAEHAAEIAAIATDAARRRLRQHRSRPLERAGSSPQPRQRRVLEPGRGRYQRQPCRRSSATSRRVLARHYQAHRARTRPCSRRVEALAGARDALDLDDEQAPRARPDATRVSCAAARSSTRRQAASGSAPSSSGSPCSAPRFGQNVLADEKRLRSACSTTKTTSPACPPACAMRPRRPRPSAAAGQARHHPVARSLIEPFLQYSSRRDLREKAFAAWIARGENGGPHDNRAVVAEIVALRAERAALLGFDSFAHYKLDDTMAKTPEAVRDLLDQVWEQAAPGRAGRGATTCAAVAAERRQFRSRGRTTGAIMPKRSARRAYDLDEAEIKSYFALDNVIAAAFDTGERLFGLDVHRAARRAGLSSGRAGLRGHRQRRPPRRAVPRRLFRPALEAVRRLEQRFPRARSKLDGDIRPDRRQRHELRQGRRGRADPARASTTRARCSTSSATRCTPCCPT